VAVGSFLVNYFADPSVAGLSEMQAATYVSYYWGGAMVGRFIGTVTLRRFDPGRVLALHGLAVVVLLAITMSTTGPVAMWSVLLIGLFNSVMFPTIFTLALARLGALTGQASGILCMAIVGGAVVPLLQGFVADAYGVQKSFGVAALCYVYVLWFGWKGYRPKEA